MVFAADTDQMHHCESLASEEKPVCMLVVRVSGMMWISFGDYMLVWKAGTEI